jgi:hypothetical protein
MSGTNEPFSRAQPKIADRCEACGAQSLFIGAGGWLTCAVVGCTASLGIRSRLPSSTTCSPRNDFDAFHDRLKSRDAAGEAVQCPVCGQCRAGWKRATFWCFDCEDDHPGVQCPACKDVLDLNLFGHLKLAKGDKTP